MDEEKKNSTRHFLLQEAIDLMRAKQPKEALPVLVQYLRIHPDSEEGWFLLSYVIQDPEKKIDCMQRVLEINPENIQARERLQKLRDALPPEVEEEPEEKTFPLWAMLSLIVVVGLIIIVGGVWGFRALFGAPPTAMAPTAEIALVETTPTPTQKATYPPGFFATATPTFTLTPSPTLPPTITPAALDDDTATQMDEIEAQVSALRKLAELAPVTRSVIEKDYVRPILESAYLERHTRDEVADQARVLSVLGLIDPTYDLVKRSTRSVRGLGDFMSRGQMSFMSLEKPSPELNASSTPMNIPTPW